MENIINMNGIFIAYKMKRENKRKINFVNITATIKSIATIFVLKHHEFQREFNCKNYQH